MKRYLSRLRPRSPLGSIGLQARIALFVSIPLVAVFIIFGYIGLQALKQSTEQSLQERLLITRMVANDVDERVARTLGNLERVAEFPSLRGGVREPAQDALRDLTLFSDLFLSSVFILDREGRVVWGDPASGAPPGADMTLYPSVRQTLELGTRAISGAVFGPLLGEHKVFLTVPMRDLLGRVNGAVGGSVALGSLGDLVAPLRLGKTGYAELVDDQGIVLASARPERLFQKDDHADRFHTLIANGKTTVATCHRCHQESGQERVRDILAFSPLQQAPWGVAVRQLDEEALASTRNTRNRMLLLAVPLLLVALYISWMTTRHVVRPIRHLTAASQRIAQGDLDFSVKPTGRDEIATLATTFDSMRSKLKASYEEIEGWSKHLEERVERRTRELSTLLQASRVVAATIDLESLLQGMVGQIIKLVAPADAGILYLHDASLGLLVPASSYGFDLQGLPRLRPGEGVAGRVFQTRQPVLLSGPQAIAEAGGWQDTGRSEIPYAGGEHSVQAVLSVPLIFKGQATGCLELASLGSQEPFSESDIPVVQAIADQMAVALENARLYQEIQTKEVQRGQLLERVITAQEEERKRISRELHDEAGQSLTALAIHLAALRDSLSAEEAQEAVAQAGDLAERLISEIRRLISDLRPTVLDDLGLVPALRRYAQIAADTWGLEVNVSAPGQRRRLSPQLETTLFRIVQEAVTNAAKHGRAHTVNVDLSQHDSRAVLQVADDGVGFDTEAILHSRDTNRGLGLVGMRERAALFGGSFQVESSPGKGTRLVIQVPLGE